MNPAKNGKRAKLQLESGYLFSGTAFGSGKPVSGEVVFNTGMVGYTEALTDPSYTGQILVLSYPLAGNYGVPCMKDHSSAFESDRICAAGLVVSRESSSPSHFNMKSSLHNWLRDQGIPGLTGVDTRAITRHLRETGTMQGSLVIEGAAAPFPTLSPAEQIMKTISGEMEFFTADRSRPTVALVDCGSKRNIRKSLLNQGLNVIRVPWNYPVSTLDCHGVLVSNGPGDPLEWQVVISELHRVLERKIPVMGICLGHQLLALAAGASTEKMKYGHRGQNQPCLEQGTEIPGFFLTSQNHGYQVVEDSLAPGWRVLFRNVNDYSVEGLIHENLPFISVQFHPEASPGPTESSSLFHRFKNLVENHSTWEVS